MKKILRKTYISSGFPNLLTLEYYYSIKGITIPVTFFTTVAVDAELTSDHINHLTKHLLK